MAALNSGGPERLRYGSLRDYVLGLQWVDGQGRLLSTGGRVMKNVAGFDLTRLLLGSCGTLGFVAELTLKVAARPDACLALVGSGSPDQVDSAAARLLDSRLEPAFLLGRCRRESLNGDSDRACLLAAGFEGFRENVEHQVSRARKAFAAGGLAIAGTRTYSCLRGARDVLPPAPEDATYVIRCDVPLDSLLELARGTAGTVLEGEFALDFGCGRLRCHTPVLAHSDWQELVSLADRLCGHPLLEVAPEQYKRSLDVFGSHRPEWDLAARLKQGLDPGGIFAPGRAPGKNAIRGASHGHSRLV
jgi:FAD/FMN-containing dehydrogenase